MDHRHTTSNPIQQSHFAFSSVVAKVMILASLGLAGIGCSSLKRYAYEGLNRRRWQRPDQVVESLGIQPGWQVADIGAGSGFFTRRFADAVGPEGKVYAADIDPDMTTYLEKRSREENRENVVIVLCKPDDPLLPEAGIDLIFLCNTYHHMEDRSTYFASAARFLKPSGRLAIVDFNGRGLLESLIGCWEREETILREMTDAGYHLEENHGFLPRQSFLIFRRLGKGEDPEPPTPPSGL